MEEALRNRGRERLKARPHPGRKPRLDKFNVHKPAVKRWLAWRPKDAPRVMVERLPPYAPDLTPAEQFWNHSKRVDLVNLTPADATDLRGRVRRSLIHQRSRPNLLASAFNHAGLSL